MTRKDAGADRRRAQVDGDDRLEEFRVARHGHRLDVILFDVVVDVRQEGLVPALRFLLAFASHHHVVAFLLVHKVETRSVASHSFDVL